MFPQNASNAAHPALRHVRGWLILKSDALLLVILLGFLIGAVANASASKAEDSVSAQPARLTTTAVKDLFRNPPRIIVDCIIEEVIYLSGSPHNTNYYRLSLQPNASKLTRYSDASSLLLDLEERAGMYVGNVEGRFEGHFWEIQQWSFQEWPAVQSGETRTNQLNMTQHVVRWVLSAFFHGGIPGNDPGTLQWSEDQVVFTRPNGHRGIGSLEVGPDGLVTGLRLIWHSPQGKATVGRTRLFDPLNFGGVILPTRIERFGGDGDKPVGKLFLLKFETAPALRPADHFAPESSFHRQLVHHTVVDASGNKTTTLFDYYRRKRDSLRWIFWVSAVVISAGGTLLYLSWSKKQQQQKRQNQ